ncbi:MAG: hypothetical protein GX134_01550 [candidate division WS1 bacterium]|jgi:hypothetical protein|nr:hypothetical protein [candidate division WS1 bacterium]
MVTFAFDPRLVGIEKVYLVVYVSRLAAPGAPPISGEVYDSREKAKEACAKHSAAGRHPAIMELRFGLASDDLSYFEKHLDDIDKLIDEYEGVRDRGERSPEYVPACPTQLDEGLRELRKLRDHWKQVYEDSANRAMKDKII